MLGRLSWDFPGGPVVKTVCFTAEGTSSIPGWRIKIPQPHSAAKKEKNE